jgi:hypothetical protein
MDALAKESLIVREPPIEEGAVQGRTYLWRL